MDDGVGDRQIGPQRLKLDLPFKRKLHLDVLPRLPNRSSSVPRLASVPDDAAPQCEKKGELMSENFDGNGRSVGWKTWDLIRQPKQKWGTGFQKVQRI
nr:hypothetical protein CFP56_05204 [Quercus suber]